MPYNKDIIVSDNRSKINHILLYTTKILTYYKEDKPNMDVKMEISFPFLHRPKLVRCDRASISVNSNYEIFFGFNQNIELYGKINLLLVYINKLILNISKTFMSNIDPLFFILNMNKYLVPSYTKFHKIYPATLFKTFHLSYLDIRKLNILVTKMLILEYENILSIIPDLYNIIKNFIEESCIIKSVRYTKINKSLLPSE